METGYCLHKPRGPLNLRAQLLFSVKVQEGVLNKAVNYVGHIKKAGDMIHLWIIMYLFDD